jgi:serine/threonine protein kinase
LLVKAVQERCKKRVGTTLDDKWHLDALLGVGGNAAVYAATHRNGKRAAIKILHPELATNDELVKRFLREGYAANRLGHPGAVSVLDDDRAPDGSVFLVMELLEGYPLDRYTRSNHAMPVELLVRVADELLDVLAAAHAKGVIHRDIKPANLFLMADGRLKVLDFGIARLAQELQLADHSATQVGTAMGTPAFMPPEQARGRWEEVDARTDLWAAGATLFALASGQRPRRAATVNEELLIAMTQPLPSIVTVVPQFPPALGAVIDRACAFEMGARWRSAHEMQNALRAAVATLRVVPQSPSASPDTAPVLHGVEGLDPRVTTSRPTVDPSLPHPVKPSSGLPVVAVAIAGVAAVLLVGAAVFVARAAPHNRAAAAAAAPATTTVIVETAAPTQTAAPPAPRDTTPELPMASATTVTTVTTGAKPATPAPTTHRAPHSAPSANLFDSRF